MLNFDFVLRALMFISAIFFPANSLLAQFNSPVERGFIIGLNNDTVPGEFLYTNSKHLFDEVLFKAKDTAGYYSVSPSDVNGFYLTEKNQLYISGNYYSMTLKENNFKMAIILGDISFFMGKDSKGKSNYWVEKNGKFAELLKENEKIVSISGNYYKTKDRPYLKKLIELTDDCSMDRPEFELTYFQLKKFGKNYAKCKGGSINEFQIPKSIYLFGFTLGLSSTPLDFKDKMAQTLPYNYSSLAPLGYYDLQSLNAASILENNFFIGFSMSILPAWNKRLSFETQLNFVKRSWSLPNEKLSFENFYVDIAPAVQYNFRLGKEIQPFVNLGFNAGLSLSSKFTSTEVTKVFNRITPRRGADTWPDEFPVNLPLLSTAEYKPNLYAPFVTIGVSSVVNKSILSFGYRYGANATLTKTALYESSVGYKSIFINIKTKLKS
ncbi:MAG: outer membrane beta-barrel protein [Cyclobacteriaceae bacterium]